MTPEAIKAMLNQAMADGKYWVIGRACWRLWQRQTNSEQQAQATGQDNGQGFNKPDARWCSRMGEWYNKGLTQYHLKPNDPKIFSEKQAKLTLPRILKYAKQLADIHNSTHKAA